MSEKAVNQMNGNDGLPDASVDDLVVPFLAEKAGARGRLARLGEVTDKILKAHDYPEPVSHFLGEMIALAALVGTSLKFDGKLILQTKSDGPISLMVVDYSSPKSIRAYAGFDAGRVSEMSDQPLSADDWLGEGVMALTIDQGSEMDRYQGIVALEGGSLGAAAEQYFFQSEQIPSLVRLHVAKHFDATGDHDGNWHWRAGGLMVQYLTSQGGIGGGQSADALSEAESEDWQRARILGDSVEAHELLDPQLSPERLLYRLYHEEGVRVYEPSLLIAECSCSAERVASMLAQFSAEDRHDMVEEAGKIEVTCEFCTAVYEFREDEF